MNDQLKWYVVRAISGKEKKVKQYIDSEISRLGVTHLVLQVLIPMEEILPDERRKENCKRAQFLSWLCID